jgi:hypothetical protein
MSKSKKPTGKFSLKKYLKEKARSFPLAHCLINEDFEFGGQKLATIAVIRQQPSGLFVIGIYMVDPGCLGLKSTTYNYNQTEEGLEENYLRNMAESTGGLMEVEYEFVHNLIFGAIDFADELGFSPDKDFAVSQYILEKDDDQVPFIDMDFGDEDGKPFFVAGPYDNGPQIVKKLTERLGPDGFHYIIPVDPF